MKRDIYAEITNRIIEQLENGVIPWKQPYLTTVGFPKNFATGKEYRGINVFLLGSLRFTSPWFLTFLQAKELGGYVKKGERGFPVIKYGTFTKECESDETSDKSEEKCGFLKIYTVFHSTQIEGIDFPQIEAINPISVTTACDQAREIIAAMPKEPPIHEGAVFPCYRRNLDTVHMPDFASFTTEESYYSTLFHELTHATGHQSRLARASLLESKGMNASGEAKKVYAEEELVAEMGASFLNAHAGIIEAELENSISYIQGWIGALKSKDAKSWIIRAASQAQKASDYILNIQPQA